MEQSLDINKLVFKEQLSPVDAARQHKSLLLNTILRVTGFPRGKPGTKISFCPTLPSLNIYTAVFSDKHKMRKKDKKEGGNQPSHSHHYIFAKTIHVLYIKYIK